VSSRAINRCFAMCIGVLLPIAELYRRRDQLGDLAMFPSWFDDVLIGAFLIYGARQTGKDWNAGRLWLAAAWAFMAAMAFGSFFGQLSELGQPDPSGAPSVVIVAIKGAGLLIGIVGFLATAHDGKSAAT
jgi:hypothetical protein